MCITRPATSFKYYFNPMYLLIYSIFYFNFYPTPFFIYLGRSANISIYLYSSPRRFFIYAHCQKRFVPFIRSHNTFFKSLCICYSILCIRHGPPMLLFSFVTQSANNFLLYMYFTFSRYALYLLCAEHLHVSSMFHVHYTANDPLFFTYMYTFLNNRPLLYTLIYIITL